ncbi:hypothetical protein GDO78_018937 [Eleutherodactylus coqui]|uniref:Uncharacterized protein n=1 Tax=Eleutherodactylus coqui TaxID=57060 RepID=A0A8J6EBR6_ELECQ|nr:hypothetical protein GDO78_018937 [Eleutherodactylus coqui]
MLTELSHSRLPHRHFLIWFSAITAKKLKKKEKNIDFADVFQKYLLQRADQVKTNNNRLQDCLPTPVLRAPNSSCFQQILHHVFP